jgi:cell division protein FtsQ
MIWRRRKSRKTYGSRSRIPFRPDVVDPKRRSRRRRSLGKAVLAIAAAAGLAYVATAAYQRMPVAPMFVIKKVEMTGLARLTPADLEPLMALKPSETLPELDLRAVHERILSHPWIREAQIRKSYPDKLEVRVVERRPFAVVQADSGDILVDETGRILGKVPADSNASRPADGTAGNLSAGRPRFTGLGPVSAGADGFVDRAAFKRAVRAVSVLNADPVGIDEPLRVDVGDRKELVVYWKGVRLRFEPDRVREGWRRFQSVENDIRERRPKAREIDLRFPDTVVVR